MLSIQKILVLVAILWIVWTVFKFFDRRNSNLKDTKKNIKCAECGNWIDGERCQNIDCQNS